MLNPITIAVELFHTAFWSPISSGSLALPPNFFQATLWAGLITIGTLVVGQWVFRKREGSFAQDL
jgi:ABC-2 type transport system permease protein